MKGVVSQSCSGHNLWTICSVGVFFITPPVVVVEVLTNEYALWVWSGCGLSIKHCECCWAPCLVFHPKGAPPHHEDGLEDKRRKKMQQWNEAYPESISQSSSLYIWFFSFTPQNSTQIMIIYFVSEMVRTFPWVEILNIPFNKAKSNGSKERGMSFTWGVVSGWCEWDDKPP